MSVVSSTLSGRRSLVWPLVYVAVALTTMSTLILELALTRIFSVVFYYHFAFLAISIALFGLGVGGVLSYYVSGHGETLFRKLGVLSALNTVAVTGSLALILSVAGNSGFWVLALVYFAAALPFLLSGMVVSLAIAETIERVDRVYFYDLLGAAGGCLLLIPFLNLVGGPGAVLTAAVLMAVSSAIWFGLSGSVRGRAVGVFLALVLTILVVVNKQARFIDIHTAKGKALGQEEFVQWNSFSRIAVTRPAGGGYLVAIDADATTGISQFDIDHLTDDDRRKLSLQGPGYVYRLRPGAKTLILGSGGGWDIARALASGSKDVTGVEINPIIANTIMRKRYLDVSRRLYERPEVRIQVEDGRSFVRRSGERYQVIQATLVDTWASTAAGAFALSENNLYTVEAFEDYFSHLTADGVIAITRWGFEPPRESLRLLSLAREALLRKGEKDLAAHVIVVREESRRIAEWGATDTVVISRKPLTKADVDRAVAQAKDAGLEVVYAPGIDGNTAFHRFLRARDTQAFFAHYRYDVSPVNDDRPFFFYTVQPRDVFRLASETGKDSADYKINLAVPTLFSLLGVSLTAVLVTLLLPPVLLRQKLPRERGVRMFLMYFLLLGAGYILIQVALIQQLVLFLGHPTYALTVVIFSMLVSSGFGSYFSRRLIRGSDGRLMTALGLVALVVAADSVVVAAVTAAGVGLPLALKVIIAILLIAPAGFLMGIPFPTGLARLEQWHHRSVRWAWSLNAAASVLGSAAAIFISIYFGLRTTLFAGAALYLLALLVVKGSRAQARLSESSGS